MRIFRGNTINNDRIAENPAVVENRFRCEALYEAEAANEGYRHFTAGSRIEMRGGNIAKEIVFGMSRPLI